MLHDIIAEQRYASVRWLRRVPPGNQPATAGHRSRRLRLPL